MERVATHTSCKHSCIDLCDRETSGGFNNVGKMVEYREAFVKSLRGYSRPASAYSKLGCKAYGLKRTPALTTGSPNYFKEDISDYGMERQAMTPDHQQPDYLVSCQLSFSESQYQAESALRKYQQHLDLRLAKPKHQRQRASYNTLLTQQPASNVRIRQDITSALAKKRTE